MPIIFLLKGWKFIFEKVAELLEHIIKYCQALPQPNDGNQINDDVEEEMVENIMPNGKGDRCCFLAVEVWTDVLGFVKRIQLARTVSLTNRRIHQICWPRLHGDKVVAHEVREITIVGRERFERGRPPKAFVLKDGKPVPIPSCPPPPYISGFHCIITYFLDEQVLAFVKLISHCIAANPFSINILHMEMTKMGEKQRASVNQLLQIFSEEKSSIIRYLNCRMANIQYLQHVDNQTSRLHLQGDKSSDIPHLMKMLASPRPDGQQRVIFVNLSGHLKKELFKAIKKEFSASTQPLPQPFYLNMYAYGPDLGIPNSEELNPQTGETLMITRNGGNRMFHIYRHPAGQHAQWAEDARKRIEWPDKIYTFFYMKIQD